MEALVTILESTLVVNLGTSSMRLEVLKYDLETPIVEACTSLTRCGRVNSTPVEPAMGTTVNPRRSDITGSTVRTNELNEDIRTPLSVISSLEILLVPIVVMETSLQANGVDIFSDMEAATQHIFDNMPPPSFPTTSRVVDVKEGPSSSTPI